MQLKKIVEIENTHNILKNRLSEFQNSPEPAIFREIPLGGKRESELTEEERRMLKATGFYKRKEILGITNERIKNIADSVLKEFENKLEPEGIKLDESERLLLRNVIWVGFMRIANGKSVDDAMIGLKHFA